MWSYFSSVVPVTIATGICKLAESVPHRLHRARAEHPQAVREILRRAARAARRRPGASAGTVANNGCASQRSRNASTPSRSTDRASSSSDAMRSARACGSPMPGDVLTRTSGLHDFGRSSASRKASRPPIE